MDKVTFSTEKSSFIHVKIIQFMYLRLFKKYHHWVYNRLSKEGLLKYHLRE